MSGTMLWVALVGGELLLILFVLLFFSWLKNASRSRADKKAMKALATKVRAAKSDREKVISEFLQRGFEMQGDALEAQKIKILREETRLMQRFIDVYKKRDAGMAAQFFMSVEAGVEPYHQLTGGTAAVAGAGGASDDELAALRKENARLSEELSVTMDTMSRMLSEYSTMFSGGELPAEGAAPDTSPVMPDDDPLVDSDVITTPLPDSAVEPDDGLELMPEASAESEFGEEIEPDQDADGAEVADDDLAGDLAGEPADLQEGAETSAESVEDEAVLELSEELAEEIESDLGIPELDAADEALSEMAAESESPVEVPDESADELPEIVDPDALLAEVSAASSDVGSSEELAVAAEDKPPLEGELVEDETLALDTELPAMDDPDDILAQVAAEPVQEEPVEAVSLDISDDDTIELQPAGADASSDANDPVDPLAGEFDELDDLFDSDDVLDLNLGDEEEPGRKS